MYKNYQISDLQRGVLTHKNRFKKLLTPGEYSLFDLGNNYNLEILELSNLSYDGRWVDYWIKNNMKLIEDNFVLADIYDNQVGLIYSDNKFAGVLPPNSKVLFWKHLNDINIKQINITKDFEILEDDIGVFRNKSEMTGQAIFKTVEVGFAGLLYVNGEFVRLLEPKSYAFWVGNNNIVIDIVDLRLKEMEVLGQEILTKDKVTLRINVTTFYKIIDPIKSKQDFVNQEELLYKTVQFAIRELVSDKTLDEILESKEEISINLGTVLKKEFIKYSAEITKSAIKDIILPGEIRALLNKVVETEKNAQANLIRRREEFAATRSQLNTSRLFIDNPVLMKLKELETLEKITENVTNLNIYQSEGLFDSILKR
jgi:regulator of protease activity HflC (stomatin/prohibitin superfamily)